jgi:glutamate transport system substrate-binding protein
MVSGVVRMVGFGMVAAMLVAGCEGTGDATSQTERIDISVDPNAATRFAKSSRMYEIAKSGTVKIGVKFDQPGLGQKPPGEDIPVGFDIDIARMLAAKLGIPTEKVQWVETESEVREKYLRSGKVDFVVASYSLSDERREVVGQAGPYYITGQRLLALKESRIKDVDDIRSAKVCAVKGSTALQNVKAKGARVVAVASTRDCLDRVLDGRVSAMTGDGGALLGYAAENPRKLAVVGEPMTRERYGVGYPKDRPELCQFILDTLMNAQQQGLWAKSFEATLGKSGAKTPATPEFDECP